MIYFVMRSCVENCNFNAHVSWFWMKGKEKTSMGTCKATERLKISAEQTMAKKASSIFFGSMFSPSIAAQMRITVKTSIIAAPMMTIKLQTTVAYPIIATWLKGHTLTIRN